MKGMKSITCDPSCGFMVRSHDEKEVMQAGRYHVEKVHGHKASDKEIKAMIKSD